MQVLSSNTPYPAYSYTLYAQLCKCQQHSSCSVHTLDLNWTHVWSTPRDSHETVTMLGAGWGTVPITGPDPATTAVNCDPTCAQPTRCSQMSTCSSPQLPVAKMNSWLMQALALLHGRTGSDQSSVTQLTHHPAQSLGVFSKATHCSAAMPPTATAPPQATPTPLQFIAHSAQAQTAAYAVACFRYAMRLARSSGFFKPANTILVPGMYLGQEAGGPATPRDMMMT